MQYTMHHPMCATGPVGLPSSAHSDPLPRGGRAPAGSCPDPARRPRVGRSRPVQSCTSVAPLTIPTYLGGTSSVTCGGSVLGTSASGTLDGGPMNEARVPMPRLRHMRLRSASQSNVASDERGARRAAGNRACSGLSRPGSTYAVPRMRNCAVSRLAPACGTHL